VIVPDDVNQLLASALAASPPPALPGGSVQLPALLPDPRLTRNLLEQLAHAYLFAELESAALIVCADAVVDARASLRASHALAVKLEAYVELLRHSPSTLEREAFYVRCFGVGRHASLDERGNHAFYPRFAELCNALGALSLRGQPLALRLVQERARGSLERLLAELSLLAGSDLLVIPRIGRLAAAAIAILSDSELAAILGAVGIQGVVSALVGGVAVDLQVAHGRGRAGQAVLQDCARLAERVRAAAAGFVEPNDPAVGHAVQWLASYGTGPTARGGLA
jgi:hypothetical protein